VHAHVHVCALLIHLPGAGDLAQAAKRLAEARRLVESQFAKYENPDLPAEYQVIGTPHAHRFEGVRKKPLSRSLALSLPPSLLASLLSPHLHL
jgi:hypothetical protein